MATSWFRDNISFRHMMVDPVARESFSAEVADAGKPVEEVSRVFAKLGAGQEGNQRGHSFVSHLKEAPQ